MLKIKCDINQQYLKTVDLHFVKSEYIAQATTINLLFVYGPTQSAYTVFRG